MVSLEAKNEKVISRFRRKVFAAGARQAVIGTNHFGQYFCFAAYAKHAAEALDAVVYSGSLGGYNGHINLLIFLHSLAESCWLEVSRL
jgi:hypothetical protein